MTMELVLWILVFGLVIHQTKLDRRMDEVRAYIKRKGDGDWM